ncbi:branched-chain amino acid aminotransferase [Pelagibius sp. Alg239-R121]|uniref:branched-chain amino acid aminotransferase n=1 Tax=Pelagibius sp. Alg239-R121 TaxID=2993448 RepID=UPI0024A6DFA9|nr:branched-chain amino acid aminotransferase [Pelagibius sp. Alg239-R121]
MANIPFDQREGSIWLNGAVVPWSDARVHVLTHGLHYASSVFEGERFYGGRVFKLKEHGERLVNSCRIMGMDCPYSVAELNQAAEATVKATGLSEGYLRRVIWRGSEMMGVAAQSNKINVAMAAWDWPSYFSPDALEKGLRLAISDWRRPAPDCAPIEAKAAGLYMICTLSKHAAEQAGFNDSLMFDYRGLVAEATGANVFFVKDGALHTPTPDCFLNGITRQTVMELARRRGIQIFERAIAPEELEGFEQCFLTGSAAEISPVSEIGPYQFEIGEMTKQILRDYHHEVYRVPNSRSAVA